MTTSSPSPSSRPSAGAPAGAPAGPELSPGSRLRRIVVPLTADAGHDRGVEAAAVWAGHWQEPVVLLCVESGDGAVVDVAAGERLARARDRLAAATGLAVTEMLLSGPDVAAAVAAHVDDGDLLVMSSTAGDGHPAASTAWELLRVGRRPALIMGPAAEVPELVEPGPVVVGLDGSPLAEQALEPAVALAVALGSRLWLVQAVSDAVVTQVDELRSQGDNAASASAYLRDMAALLSTRHDLASAQPPGQAVGWEVVHSGNAARSVTEFARDRGAAVVVVSTHGRSGIGADVFGSTALGIVARAPVPVLVVVPEQAEQEALTSG